jgi:hypothetical protein
MSLASYRYASTVLIASAAIVFVLFSLIQASSIRFKVNATQPLLTLSLSLLILSYIAYHGYEQDELNRWLFYATFIAAIPLLYHLLYLAFFSNDEATKITLLKIYLLGGLMVYLSLIWSNVNRLIQSEKIGSMYGDSLRILTRVRVARVE